MILEKGMKVIIKSTNWTDDNFGMNTTMQELFESQRPVTIENYDKLGECVKIQGCYWHSRDLSPFEKIKEKEPQIFHFNEKHLEV
jgi:hypothetical protein